MSKQEWINHIRSISGGIIPPSQGGDPHDWHSALAMHKSHQFMDLYGGARFVFENRHTV